MAFDLNAWLSEASLPEASVTVYAAAGVAAEVHDLGHRIDSESDDAARAELVARRDELVKRLEASALTVRVRALTDSQRSVLNASHPEPGDGADEYDREQWDQAYTTAMVAIQAYEPKMPDGDWRKVRDAIGPAAFGSIIRACIKANTDNVADADFLRRSSATTRH